MFYRPQVRTTARITSVRLLIATGVWLVAAGAASASAETHWVSPTGASAWTECSGPAPRDGSAACSVRTANSSAAAGDLVYFRGGTYVIDGDYVWAISPRRSGIDASNMITFMAYPGEAPVFLRGRGIDGAGVWLRGVSYFKLEGFTFRNFQRFGQIDGSSHHNEIARNTFIGDTGEEGFQGFWIVELCPGGTSFRCPATHNWLHHNTFARMKTTNPGTCSEGTDLVRIGYSNGTGDSQFGNDYNTVEDNVMYHAGHSTFDGYGLYTVFRNNVMHNEPWWSSSGVGCRYANDGYANPAYLGKYGHRTFQITDGGHRDGTYALIEGNRSGYGSPNPENNGADGMAIAAPRNIVRYNTIFGAMNSCLLFKYGWVDGAGGNGGSYNRAYNNTLYHCGYGNPWYEANHQPRQNTSPEGLLAVQFYWAEAKGNVLKNNLIYDSRRYALSGFDIGFGAHNSGVGQDSVIAHNWLSSSGDPRFVNPDMTDPMSTTLPNLALQRSSGAIDGGTFLTKAVGAKANSIVLAVSDALYFQDGTWGSDLARGVSLFPDWIAIGNVENIVAIRSIDYESNTITLAAPKSWSDGAPIWLYRKSDGTVVLRGSAPDFGASEFGALAPPLNIRIGR